MVILTPKQDDTIAQVLRVFETGNVSAPQYGAISDLRDGTLSGKRNQSQISYGYRQFTESSSLPHVLCRYILEGGARPAEAARALAKCLPYRAALSSDPQSLKFLRQAATEAAMHKAQTRTYREEYHQPALKQGMRWGFVQPLSYLVILDSYTQSGGVPWWIRKRFAATPDEEKLWITQYVEARHHWLKNHRVAAVRRSRYRTRTLKQMIDQNRWDLKTPFTVIKQTIT